MIEKRCDDLRRVSGRMKLLSAHDALLILRSSLSAPKVMHNLRSSPCAGHPLLNTFDRLLRENISSILNVDISEIQWLQASLPVSEGGLGVRSVALLAPSAFLASAAGTLTLQDSILSQCDSSVDTAHDLILSMWKSLYGDLPPLGDDVRKQRCWDKISITQSKQNLLAACPGPQDRSRLLAIAAPHSGDWLQALPISSCGLRLDDESIRVATGLRLGAVLCAEHHCPCGALVDCLGTHGLACKRSAGRIARHQSINDLIHRALTRANVPSMKEPVGLLLSGKRPDGMTLIPWHNGRCLTWDVTVTDTMAASYLSSASVCAGSVAELAADRKIAKYQELMNKYEFCPIAFETMGPVNELGLRFIEELGARLSMNSGDQRETMFLFQRLSVAVQRYNAICFSGTFVPIPKAIT